MANAKLGKEVYVETSDEVGMLAKISTLLANAGINVSAICGQSVGGKAVFRLITSDNRKAIEIIKPLKFTVKEQEVVILDVENKVGALAEACRKLSSEKANLIHIYGSASNTGEKSILVISSNDNAKVAKIFV